MKIDKVLFSNPFGNLEKIGKLKELMLSIFFASRSYGL